MNVIYPTIPGSASLRLIFEFERRYSGFRQMYLSVNFTVAGTAFSSGYTELQFRLDTTAAMGWLTSLCYSQATTVNGYWLINFSSTSYKQTTFAYGSIVGGPPFTPYYIGASIQLRTATISRNGTGRLHFPWLQQSDLDTSTVLPAFASRVAAFTGFLTSAHLWGGVTFHPAVWSRDLGVLLPIVQTVISPRTSICRKRRPSGGKVFNPIAWPHNW